MVHYISKGMTPEVEHGDPLNTLSPQPESPNPDVVNHDPNTMDISNETNQQPSDHGDVSGVCFESSSAN